MFSYPELVAPEVPAGLVVIPHLTGGTVGPRLNYLAWLIRQAGFATALSDLAEAREASATTGVLADRLAAATATLRSHTELAQLPLAYMAAGSSAAAVLTAVSREECPALAVVVHGGRIDVPGTVLERIRVPVLLIAPGNDTHALRTMRHALTYLRCAKRLDVIAGAHHQFEEPGALCRVALHARRWLRRHLPAGAPVPLGLVHAAAGKMADSAVPPVF